MRIAGCGSAAPSVSTTCACSHGKRYKWHSDSAYRPGPLLLAAVRRALIGETQARGFQEAAAKWHRYADDRGDARRATNGQAWMAGALPRLALRLRPAILRDGQWLEAAPPATAQGS